MNVTVTSDGTIKGTTLVVDGEEVDFNSFYLSGYANSFCNNIGFDYSTREEDKEKQLSITTSYYYDPSIAKFIVKKEESESDIVIASDYEKM